MTISPSPIDQTGDHRVYARWPAPSGNATNATYTVTYEGGTASVVVNQRVNGGQWVLLGTFPFAASGGGYKVELADNALGTVAADAIHVVRETVASDSFTWTPAIPASGTYDLYARWTAASGNSAAASYTVVHGTGTDVVTVSQKQNGGQWHHLGTYEFEPDAGHQVTLTAAADGAVVADAIRLVGTGPAPADIAYIHADQLGTPQKLTDAAQAIVWDRVQDPFGRQVSLTAGTGVANPLRFPGQLFDAESGFHYNYFRDYDPSTGRYIQSDPIGLGGGINTFAYVGGNPTRRRDIFGLEEYPDDFVGPLPPSGYYTSEMIFTECGPIPPFPPGADPIKNMEEAQQHFDPRWFYNQVRNKGPWDYKQTDPVYEDAGNFNFGSAGHAYGFLDEVLKRGAGAANQMADPTRTDLGTPWGGPPYGDDPQDQQQIDKGIQFCKCMGIN